MGAGTGRPHELNAPICYIEPFQKAFDDETRVSIFLGTASCLLAGCATPNTPHLVGSERDPHGCIPSAGYLWCQKTASCQRPWELAAEHGFVNTAQNWQQFCQNPPEKQQP